MEGGLAAQHGALVADGGQLDGADAAGQVRPEHAGGRADHAADRRQVGGEGQILAADRHFGNRDRIAVGQREADAVAGGDGRGELRRPVLELGVEPRQRRRLPVDAAAGVRAGRPLELRNGHQAGERIERVADRFAGQCLGAEREHVPGLVRQQAHVAAALAQAAVVDEGLGDVEQRVRESLPQHHVDRRRRHRRRLRDLGRGKELDGVDGLAVAEVARAVVAEEVQRAVGEGVGREAAQQGLADDVVLVELRPGLAARHQEQRPARLDGAGRIQRVSQVVPGDVRHHGAHAVLRVHRLQQELIAAAVARAEGPHLHGVAAVTRDLIEIRLRPVQDRDQIAALGVRIHDAHRPGGFAEAALVDADDVVPAIDQRGDGAAGLGLPAAAVAVALQDQRIALAGHHLARLEELEDDDAVDRRRDLDALHDARTRIAARLRGAVAAAAATARAQQRARQDAEGAHSLHGHRSPPSMVDPPGRPGGVMSFVHGCRCRRSPSG